MSYMPQQPEKAEVGAEAPAISIADEAGEVSLKDFKGKSVILNFWSKYDAPSRLANHSYARAAEASAGKVAFISICVDDSDESLARMITAEDGLSDSGQYFASQLSAGDNSMAYDGRACGAWLIDPNGIIAAHNPSASAIAAL